MNDLGQVLSYRGLDNIETKGPSNIDTIIDSETTSKYALKRDFSPRTEETQVAEEIAGAFGDTKNYAYYRWAVQKASPAAALRLFHETQDDIKRQAKTDKPIRNPGALFHWKVNKFMRERGRGR